jgi:hypothetical protein
MGVSRAQPMRCALVGKIRLRSAGVRLTLHGVRARGTGSTVRRSRARSRRDLFRWRSARPAKPRSDRWTDHRRRSRQAPLQWKLSRRMPRVEGAQRRPGLTAPPRRVELRDGATLLRREVLPSEPGWGTLAVDRRAQVYGFSLNREDMGHGRGPIDFSCSGSTCLNTGVHQRLARSSES